MTIGQTGCVVIGRNEGERLLRCLTSLRDLVPRLIYVDSCSTDNSVEIARSALADVVVLDKSVPFSAARARNAGLEHLNASHPELRYVQFIDGDCELNATWLPRALRALEKDDALAVVCGRRRERYPDRSLYNLVCDLEWDTPIGPAKACGGDALMRISALVEVGAYDPRFVAGEEPEMCLRLRQAGWTIHRIDAEMTLHDAAIYNFGDWWKRQLRYGYALAMSAAKHGNGPERYKVKEILRALVWSVTLPFTALAIALITPWALLVLLAYPLQFLRNFINDRSNRPRRGLRAALTVAARFAETAGLMKYARDRVRGELPSIIEYKRSAYD